MYSNKRRFIGKGYIITYILLICSILMIMILYVFTLEVRRYTNTRSYMTDVQKNIKQEDYREYLFTILYENLTDNVLNLSNSNIKEYLIEQNSYFKSEDLKAVIKYDLVSNRIYLDTPVDSYNFRRDLYDYKIVENRLKFVFIKTLYIEGKVQ